MTLFVQGKSPNLTRREREVCLLVFMGKTSKEIARLLGIAPSTVNYYREQSIHKFGVTSTRYLVHALNELGDPSCL